MVEYLDYYNENGTYLGKEKRDIVHKNALWHNTVHCWLYDIEGNIYFQIRKEEGKLYTTASGHVLAGESIKEAFGREVYEEIGIKVDYNNAIFVNIYKFIMDKKKKDGSVFKDRAFSNVYICNFNKDYNNFKFDTNEVEGLVQVNVEETIKLLTRKKEKIEANFIKQEGDKIVITDDKLVFEDFLVNKGETAISKYGDILNKVIEVTKKSKK